MRVRNTEKQHMRARLIVYTLILAVLLSAIIAMPGHIFGGETTPKEPAVKNEAEVPDDEKSAQSESELPDDENAPQQDAELPDEEDTSQPEAESPTEDDTAQSDEQTPETELPQTESDTEPEPDDDAKPLFFGAEFNVWGKSTPVSIEISAEKVNELPEIISIADIVEFSDTKRSIDTLLPHEYAGWVETDSKGELLLLEEDPEDEVIPDELAQSDAATASALKANALLRGAKEAIPKNKVLPAKESGSDNEVYTLDGVTALPKVNAMSTEEVEALPLKPDVTRYFSAVMPLEYPDTPDHVAIGGVNNEPLKAFIYKDGRQDVRLYDATKPHGYENFENRQFYSQEKPATPDDIANPSVGWILHLYEGDSKWSVGKGDGNGTSGYLQDLSQNSNTISYKSLTASPDGRTATAVMSVKYKGNANETLDIVLTYHIDPSSRQMPVTVKLKNNTGRNFTKMNFIFAEDSYFGASLQSTGRYNALANMVYVWKDHTRGIMSISGSAATPFDNWDVDLWLKMCSSSKGDGRLKNDTLKSPVSKSSGEEDTVLAAGWRFHNFHSGRTINLKYYESWTAPSDLQVIAPAGKTAPPDARVSYVFHIINLSPNSVSTTGMKLVSSHGWPVRLTSGSQNLVIPPGGMATVTARIIVPPKGTDGVVNGAKDNLTLEVYADGKECIGSTTTTVDTGLPALNITKVRQTKSDVTFRVDFLNTASAHSTNVSILDMDGNHLQTPPSQTRTVESGAEFTFPSAALKPDTQYIAEADARPGIIFPARTTFKIEPMVTVTFDANGGSTPDPEKKSVIVGQPYIKLATTARSNYSFDGWYTEKNGGDKVTETTLVKKKTDHTLYAHWTAPLIFTKVNASDLSPLPGAKFRLFVCNNVNHKTSKDHSTYDPYTVDTSTSCWESIGSAESGADGKVSFGNIKGGHYLLRETLAPDGYECPHGWWIITVDDTAAHPITSIAAAGPHVPPAFIADKGNSNLRLPNYKKVVLPLTGSTPRKLAIVIIGAALLFVVAWLLFMNGRRRRLTAATSVSDCDSTQLKYYSEDKRVSGAEFGESMIRILRATIVIVLIFGLCCISIQGFSYADNPDKGSITIHKYSNNDTSKHLTGTGIKAPQDVTKLPSEGKPLSGIGFTVRKVIQDPTPGTTKDVVFSDKGKSYVNDDSGVYTPHTVKTNAKGKAFFGNLPIGIYLIREHGAKSPFLVGIPTVVSGASGTVIFDVDVYPKTSGTNSGADDNDDDNEPNNNGSANMPGTGDDFPILSTIGAMVIAGAILLLLLLNKQLFLRKKSKKGDEK